MKELQEMISAYYGYSDELADYFLKVCLEQYMITFAS